MTAIEKYLNKKNIVLKPKKVKDNSSNISTSAKQKELLLKIAKDLGYLE